MAGIRIMSRKTLMIILAIIGAVLAFFSTQFGLDINVEQVMATVTMLLLWVGFEARTDIKRIITKVGEQQNKTKDPKFWLAFLTMILTVLSESLGWNLPITTIVAVLTAIMGVLFKLDLTAIARGFSR